jgi:hypothetical protein
MSKLEYGDKLQSIPHPSWIFRSEQGCQKSRWSWKKERARQLSVQKKKDDIPNTAPVFPDNQFRRSCYSGQGHLISRPASIRNRKDAVQWVRPVLTFRNISGRLLVLLRFSALYATVTWIGHFFALENRRHLHFSPLTDISRAPSWLSWFEASFKILITG